MPLDDVSHFAMVGFPVAVRDADAMVRSMDPILKACAFVEVDRNNRLCVVRDKSGGELRVALRSKAGQDEFVTANPGFTGEGRTEVAIVAVTPSRDKDYAPYEIRISAQFKGEKTPLIFDLADPQQLAAFKPGAKMAVDIAAFSFAPEFYADSASYYRAQEKPDETTGKSRAVFADNFFIPSGMFLESVGGSATSEGPAADADFAGTVVKAERRTNAAGGGTFWWALVRTYNGALIDVVLAPETVPNPIKAGSIISGRFWLSARLATPISGQSAVGTGNAR